MVYFNLTIFTRKKNEPRFTGDCIELRAYTYQGLMDKFSTYMPEGSKLDDYTVYLYTFGTCDTETTGNLLSAFRRLDGEWRIW